MNIRIVSTAVELKSALASAQGGDRIELRAGDYGVLSLRDLSFASGVTLTAHEEEPPQFNSISLWECGGLIFDKINLDFEPTIETLEWSSPFRVDGSSNISIVNSTITGGNAVGGINADSPAGSQGSTGINGFPIGVGLSFHHSNDITIENNLITEFSSGVRFNDVDGIAMNENEIHSVRKVPVGGAEVDNVHMEGNYFHDLTPWKFGGLGDHGDFVHFWTNPDQEIPSQNLVFINNFFAQGDGVPVLGVYLDDNNNDMGFEGVLIKDNVIHLGNAQAMRMEDVVGLQILDNTLVQASGTERDAPKIYLDYGNRDVVIDGNIYSGVTGRGMENLGQNNISIRDNMSVQVQDPLAVDYVGDIFVDALSSNPSLADFKVPSGSILDGYGANLGEVTEAFISDTRGAGMSLSTHAFDLNLEPSAEVIWDFGDGQTGKGMSTEHTYAEAGVYQAIATVKPDVGATYQLNKTIRVIDPIPVYDRFEGDTLEDAQALPGVESVAAREGNAIRLEEAQTTLSFDADEGLRNNPEFTLSIAFRKDDGMESDGGRILYFSGTAVIDLTADGISLRGSTNAGEPITLQANGTGINDAEWHQITYTMSKAEGSAILYLDGQEIARVDGLTGGQHTTFGHDLHVGNPFGENFSGLLDEVAFLRGALSPEQVAESYLAFESGEALFSDLRGLSAEPEDKEPPSSALADGAIEGAMQEPSPSGVDESMAQDPVSTLDQFLAYSAGTGLYVYEDGEVNHLDADMFSSSAGINLGSPGVASRIDREYVADLLGQDAFSISMTLTADSAASAGEVARLHHSFIASVTEKGELHLQMFTEAGERLRYTTDGANLADTNAHHIEISLNSGVLDITVDGSTLASSLMTSPLANKGSHDLTFGNPWGQENFDGKISAFSMSLSGEPSTVVPSAPATTEGEAQSTTSDDLAQDNAASTSQLLSYEATTGLSVYGNGEMKQLNINTFSSSAGIDLGGPGVASRIDRGYVADFLGQDAFSIAMTLAADSAGSAGEVARLHESFLITVTEKGELHLQAFTEGGERLHLTTNGANLSDTSSHDITISLNKGVLDVSVDGDMLASTVMSSPLADKGAHDLTFGNPWGKENFDGTLSAFEISLPKEHFTSSPQQLFASIFDGAFAEKSYENSFDYEEAALLGDRYQDSIDQFASQGALPDSYFG